MSAETDPDVNLAKADSAKALEVFRELLTTQQLRNELLRLHDEVRRAEWAEYKANLETERAEVRVNAERRELTMDALIEALEDKTGLDHVTFTREYVTHLIQPYCGCGLEDADWLVCDHARDEGF